MRLPYKSNIETTDSIDLPYKKPENTNEVHEIKLLSSRPSDSSSDVQPFDLPFKSIRVTNHLK